MEHINEILKIIEQGYNTNAPADVTVSVIKQYCESVIETNQNKGGKND